MKRLTSIIATLALGLSIGCAKMHSAESSTPPTDTLNVAATAILTTVKMGVAIPDSLHNALELKSQGLQKKYHARYTFNAGANTAFKIMQINSHIKCSASDGKLAYTTKYLLTSKVESREVALTDTIALSPNTEYTLELSIPTHNCSGQMDVAFDVVAFADAVDAAIAKPQRARVCASSSPAVVLFFLDYSPYAGISADDLTFRGGRDFTATNMKLFMDSNIYCGTKFDLKAAEVTIHMAINATDQDYMLAHATDTTGAIFQAKVGFDNVNKGGSVTCSNGKDTLASVSLTNCINVIADETMAETLRMQE